MSILVKEKSKAASLTLIKLSVAVRRTEFRIRLERTAFDLLERVASRDYEAALGVLETASELVGFGRVIYEIEPLTAKFIHEELGNLNSAIRQIAGLDSEVESFSQKRSNVVSKTEKTEDIKQNIDEKDKRDDENTINSAIRQSAIIEKIRQSGNSMVQLKDLIAEFPDVSERTLRYDLQKLCNSGAIERVGLGGPGTFYRLVTPPITV